MSDNCFWINEIGCIETCATGEELPDLPDGWIRFDSEPAPIAGRSFYNTWMGESRSPMMSQPAFGNGRIVIAANYHYGVTGDGSQETYAVFASADHGFTYSDCIEKFPWLPGAGSYYAGYDACPYWRGTHEHFGTKISFDGTTFYVVSNTGNDIGEDVQDLVTSRSTDGESWTTEIATAASHTVLHSDSWDAKLYYLGANHVAYNWTGSASGPYFTAGLSMDHGQSWVTHEFTEIEHDYGAAPYDEFSSCSAADDGFHVAFVGTHNVSGDYGVFYYRPTSDSTWGSPVLLFDMDWNADTSYSEYGTPVVLASRKRPGEVYVGAVIQDWSTGNRLVWRRSTDGGATFGPEIVAWLADSEQEEDFYAGSCRNPHVAVELDDGRIVVVFVYYANIDGNYPDLVGYVVSEDGMQTFSDPVVLTDEWIFDNNYYGQRIRACAKGNDVVITQSRRSVAANAMIFRP